MSACVGVGETNTRPGEGGGEEDEEGHRKKDRGGGRREKRERVREV